MIKNNIVLVVLLVFFTSSVNAQIISLDEFYYFQTHRDEVNLPDNLTEIRDLNNILQPYVGIWRGSISNQRTLEIHTSVATVPTFDNVLIDRLQTRYKITDANNIVLYETLSIADNNHINIIESDLVNPNGKIINFYAEPGECGRVCDVYYDLTPAVPGTSAASLQVVALVAHDVSPKDWAPCNGSFSAPKIPVREVMNLTKI